MSGNDADRAPRDLEQVNITEDWEIRWWSTKLAITEDQLRSAVEAVGPTTAKIERHLSQAARQSLKSMGED